MRRTTISIPQRLATLLRQRLRDQSDVTQIQFILSAIEDHEANISELINAERPTAGVSKLFPDTASLRNPMDARTTINFDTSEGNLKVIDSLVAKHGAESRSQLVRVVLRAALEAAQPSE